MEEKRWSTGKKLVMAIVLIPIVTISTFVLAGLLGMVLLAPEIMIPLIAFLGIVGLPGLITGLIIAKK